MKNKLYEKNRSHCSVGRAAYHHKFRGGTGADLHIQRSGGRSEFSAYHIDKSSNSDYLLELESTILFAAVTEPN